MKTALVFLLLLVLAHPIVAIEVKLYVDEKSAIEAEKEADKIAISARLKSKEGHYIVLPVNVIEQSSSLRELLQDIVIGKDAILVSDINDKTLQLCGQLMLQLQKRSNVPAQIVTKYLGSEDEQSLKNVIVALRLLHLRELEQAVARFKADRFQSTPIRLYKSVFPTGSFIIVNNTTNDKLYAAMFYVREDGSAFKYEERGTYSVIKPQASQKIGYNTDERGGTELFIANDKAQRRLLEKDELSAEEVELVSRKSFEKTNVYEWTFNGVFEILYDPLAPFGIRVSSAGGGLFQKAARKAVDVSDVEGVLLAGLEEKFQNPQERNYHPADEAVAARKKSLNSIISSRKDLVLENDFVAHRAETVRTCLKRIFGIELPRDTRVPKIALVFSGGGYRAMVETIGYLKGAASKKGLFKLEDGNILDCITYVAGLSGSTWAINPLVASGLSPDEFSQRQRSKLVLEGKVPIKALVSKLVNSGDVRYLERRFVESRYGQSHGPVGLYGHALAHTLLTGYAIGRQDAHRLTLSDLRANLEEASRYPLPISVATSQGRDARDVTWYEFSPYYVGIAQPGGSFVDSKLFGSAFRNGVPVHIAPELRLAKAMGIWGSAFAVSTEDIQKRISVLGYLAKFVTGLGGAMGTAYRYLLETDVRTTACEGRAAGGEIPNFNYQYVHPDVARGFTESADLCLVDAGITMKTKYAHNLATVPVLARGVDMIIICDSPMNPDNDKESEHLLASDEEARNLGFHFPTLLNIRTQHAEELANMPNAVYSYFEEEGAPIVLYMKGKTNNDYDPKFNPDAKVAKFTDTFNFNYTPAQFDRLSGLTESIFIQSKEKIAVGINKAMVRIRAAAAH